MTSRYPVYLIDDDLAVREGLSLLFRTRKIPILTFADPQSFLARVDSNKPGLLVVDLSMPRVSGLDLHQRLLERGILWPLTIITGHGDVAACRSAFRAGVADFLTKPVDADTLFASISMMERQLDTALERQQALALLSKLTPRENEILSMIYNGLETREIANALNVSPRTVDSHRVNICTKLRTSSIVEFVHLNLRPQA